MKIFEWVVKLITIIAVVFLTTYLLKAPECESTSSPAKVYGYAPPAHMEHRSQQ